MTKLFLILFFIFPTLVFGQEIFCKKNPKYNDIKICSKTSYYELNKKTNEYHKYIDLTTSDLKLVDSLQISCDSLIISSFMVSNGDCGVDFMATSNSNKFTELMKTFFSKNCFKNVYIEEITAVGKSGKTYKIDGLKIRIK